MRSFDEDIKKHIGEYGSIPFRSWNEKIGKEELLRNVHVIPSL